MISAEQKAFRQGKLGASDAGAALGVSPFKTRAQLAAEILHPQERVEGGPKNYGNILEPALAEMYEDKMGEFCMPYDTYIHHYRDVTAKSPTAGVDVGDFGMAVFLAHEDDDLEFLGLMHKAHDWLICHPDNAYPSGKKLVEFKSVGPRMNRGWGDDGDPDGVPLYVTAQCAVQAMLSGIYKVDVAAYFGGTDFRVYPLEFTQEFLGKILDRLKEFWGYIERKEMPPLTEDDSEVPQQFFPKHIPEKVETADARITELAKRSAISRRLKKQYEDEYKALDIEIKAYMKESEGLVDSDGKLLFTWKADKDSEKVDWEGAFNNLCEWLTKFSAIADGLDEKTESVIQRNTTPVTGSRKLLCKIKETE